MGEAMRSFEQAAQWFARGNVDSMLASTITTEIVYVLLRIKQIVRTCVNISLRNRTASGKRGPPSSGQPIHHIAACAWSHPTSTDCGRNLFLPRWKRGGATI